MTRKAQDACGTQKCGAEDFFDKKGVFVLDIRKFSTIIYIWYEGG
jgi:hypothetical protein